MKYGCIGEHLKHSFSKEIHGEFADYEYEICEIERNDLEKFMKNADFSAINVTIPYKEAVIPYLYEISPVAKKIGSVNTVVNRDGKLFGYNTDFFGMKALIERAKIDVSDKKTAILGTGGTSKTACALAESLGASEVIRVSRREAENSVTYEQLYRDHSDTKIIINCTPVGMFPSPDISAVDLCRLPEIEGVADAVYNPLNTELYKNARARGINASCGLYMLVAQAVRASEIFLDKKYPQSVIDSTYLKIRKSKENIVLTGMPASGKSTVGETVAKKLGRDFIDCDKLIEERAGCKISEIFSRDGEDAFRRIESEIIDEISNKNGLIISTGGGAVLREENIRALTRNGIIFFLDRSLGLLMPTSDRPLSSTAEDMRRRYNERYPIYLMTSDVKIDGDGSISEVADEVIKEFEKYEDTCNKRS